MLKRGEEIRIVELAERMIRMRGLRPYKDIEIKFTGVRPGEIMHEEPQGEREIPSPTVHPDIIQLLELKDTFDTETFLDQVETLLNQDLGDEISLFSRLLEIITPG